MELIERYLHAVCRNLPSRCRKKIEQELRSSIMDELEARTEGGVPGEKDILEVLSQFGPPESVARKYTGKGIYLIGPELYDLYFLVLKLASVCVLVAVAINFVLNNLNDGFTGTDILGFTWRLASGIFGVIGAITMAFILAERLNPAPDSENGKAEAEWDPKSLPEVPRSCEAIKISDVIFGMVFTLLICVILNFYPLLIRNYFQTNDPEVSLLVSLVDLGVIKPFMVYINILFGLAFLKSLLLLRDYRYRLHTLIMELVIDLGSLVILVLLLLGPTIIEAPAPGLISIDIAELNRLIDVISGLYRGVLLLSGIGFVGDLARNTVRFVQYLTARRESARAR